MKLIALCGADEALVRSLERRSPHRIAVFPDEAHSSGDVNLAYYLRSGGCADLAVVCYPGAEGLSACDYLRKQLPGLNLLWLCPRAEFEAEAQRLRVGFCLTGPPEEGVDELADIIIKHVPNGVPTPEAELSARSGERPN